jgi:transposase
VDSASDATLDQHIEIWERTHGVRVSPATMCRALQRAKRPRKKTLGARARDAVQRLLFADVISALEAQRVIVVDERGTHMGMTAQYARAAPGQPAYDTTLRNYGHNLTLLSGLRLNGIEASMVIEGAVYTAVFETYVRQVLAPTLSKGDSVVLDNLSCHKGATVQALIQQRGASILWLPPYSPDFSPIEHAFSKLKTFLRQAKAHTLDALFAAITQALLTISAPDAIA